MCKTHPKVWNQGFKTLITLINPNYPTFILHRQILISQNEVEEFNEEFENPILKNLI